MDFGSVLSRALEIMRKHKVLWIFGILAGCSSSSSGSGGGNNFRWNNTNSSSGQLPPQIQEWFNQFSNIPGWMIALGVGIMILVILLLVVIAIFLGTMGRVGLIRGTVQADRGAERLEFGELFSGSMPYFWRVFGLNLLIGLAFAAIILVIAVPLAITVVGLVCLIPLLCLLVPIGWVVNIIIEQASIAMVVENLGMMAGLQRAWDVVKNNIGNVIVMALILGLGVGLIGGFIIGFPIFLIVLPAIFGAMAGTRQAIGGSLLITGLCLVAYLPVLIFLNGLLRGYIETAWTLTFLRLTGRPNIPVVPAEPAPLA